MTIYIHFLHNLDIQIMLYNGVHCLIIKSLVFHDFGFSHSFIVAHVKLEGGYTQTIKLQ